MKLFIAIFIFLLGVAANSEAMRELTLSDYLKLSEKNDPSYKKIVSERERAGFVVEQGLPTEKVTVTVGNEYGYSSESNDDTSVLLGGITKEITHTGTSLAITHTNRTRPDREENVTELRLEQSLLNNFFGSDVRLKRSALEQESQRLRFLVEENHENYLLERTQEFLEFQKQYLDLLLAEEVFAEALKLQKNVEQKQKANIATVTDFDRSRLQSLLREEDLLSKRRSFNETQSNIQKAVGLENLALVPKEDLEKSLNKKVQQLRDYTELRPYRLQVLARDKAQKELTLAKRARRPIVNLVVGYGVDNSQRFSAAVDREETVVGFNLEMPFTDNLQRAAVKSAVLAQSQADLDRALARRELAAQARSLQSQLEELRRKVSVGQEKITLVKRILKDEERRFRFGKIDLENLIETKNNYAAYRFQYRADLVEYNKVYYSWLAINDRLL